MMANLPNIPIQVSVSVGLISLLGLGLFFTGESPWLSLIYGLIGGLSAYYILTWWQNDEKPEVAKEPIMIPFYKDINQVLIKSKLVRPSDGKGKGSKRGTSILEWMLKSDKSPPD